MIYLHIGYPKTATTHIQEGLFGNRDHLLKNGILYPESGLDHFGHHNIYFELIKQEGLKIPLASKYDPSKGGMDDLLDELSKFKKDTDGTIILSSEAFFTLSEVSFRRLILNLKSIDEVTVLLVLRRQDKWMQSFWSMQVSKMNTSLDFADWLEQEGFPPRANYNMKVSHIQDYTVDCNLQLLGFEEMKKNVVFKEFLGACNLPGDFYDELSKPFWNNKSLKGEALELMRMMGDKYGNQSNPQLANKLSARIEKLYERSASVGSNHMSPKSYKLIKDKYLRSNNLLLRRFPHLRTSLAFDEELKGSQKIKEISTLKRIFIDMYTRYHI